MGKASKWIRNLLIGKKEEKNKKKLDSCICEEKRLVVIQSETPKVKRRWSFGRSGSSSTGRKSTRSFDSIVTKGVLGFENEIAKAATSTGPLQAAAATRIQAFFRSYLWLQARKALCALRGLVKLQAVVRGHLVRKQTTSMLRCMNSLMAIQVRARLHRIQESHLLTKRRSTSHGGVDLLLQEDVHPLVPLPLYTTTQQAHEMKVVNEPISGHTHNPETQERIMEHRYHHSRKREDDSASSLSSRTYGSGSRAFEEEHHSINIAVSQRRYSTPLSQDYYDTTPTSHQFVQPSYMANTESSRAKVRSQSEPKQRPLDKQKCRTRTASPPSNAQHPWLIKLYRSTKSSKDIIHSHSTTNINSSYCKTLIAYEPAVNLY